MKFPVATGDPGPPDAGPLTTPPVMVPMAVFWMESKSSNSTAPGTEVVVTPRMSGDRDGICRTHGQHTPGGGKRRAKLRLHDASPLDLPPQPQLASATGVNPSTETRLAFCGQPVTHRIFGRSGHIKSIYRFGRRTRAETPLSRHVCRLCGR